MPSLLVLPMPASGLRIPGSRRDTQSPSPDSSIITWTCQGSPGPGGTRHCGPCPQVLPGPPRAQDARRVASPLPAVQGLLDADLVMAQHHHVDVTMLADRPPP